LGVSFDTQAENARFATHQEFPYPLLCDTGREMGLAYGATSPGKGGNAARIGVVIDTDGTVMWWGKAGVQTFAQESLAMVRS
jgi:peroxiredoxin